MGLDEYDVGKAAGRGKFSTVYRAKRRADKTTVALKKINVGTFLSISHLSSLISHYHHHHHHLFLFLFPPFYLTISLLYL